MFEALNDLAMEAGEAGDYSVACILNILLGSMAAEEYGHLEKLVAVCMEHAKECIAELGGG